MPYAELAVTTNFTFLTGASHPEEMVERAAELGLAALAITDRNTLAGVVRARVEARRIVHGLPGRGCVGLAIIRSGRRQGARNSGQYGNCKGTAQRTPGAGRDHSPVSLREVH